MPTPAKIDWRLARGDYEVAGMSGRGIAKKYGVSPKAVQKRIEKEGWTLNVRATVRRETEAKVAGIVASDDPATKDRKVDDEAAKRAELVKRHRLEWDFVRSYTAAAMGEAAKVEGGRMQLSTGDIHQEALRHMRFAKVATDAVRARQDGERQAFGLDEAGRDDDDDLTSEQLATRIMQILNDAEHSGTQ